MPLKKLTLKAGVNRENTRYTNENGYYVSDKVRFRQGTPEKIGGWTRISDNFFLGVCRSLWNWVTLGGANLLGVGTNLKFYIGFGGAYYDITPLRTTVTLGADPFSTQNASTTVTVTDASGGWVDGDFVTFSGMTLSSVAITGTAGQFSCAATTLSVGLGIQVSGTLSGTGTITGYTDPKIYYIIATNGTTTFTLSATSGGSAITTTAGTTAGLTFTRTVGGLNLTGEYQITSIVGSASTYNIQAATPATSTATGGGSTVSAAYQINVGAAVSLPIIGWGAGPWGGGTWGNGTPTAVPIRLWSQSNFGENLVFGFRGGPIYYWINSAGLTTRATLVSYGGSVTFSDSTSTGLPTKVTSSIAFSEGTILKFSASGSMPGGVTAGAEYSVANIDNLGFNILASGSTTPVSTTTAGSGVVISSIVDVPIVQNYLIVSDASRFVFAFGVNDYGSSVQNPMLLRWSDQENITQWTPNATNQAGSLLLSHGSKIVTALQTRQEIVVFTDSSLYSLQYQGPPVIWSSQLLGDNISIVSSNAAAIGSGIVYWMGVDKFYKYDGRVQTLRCDLLKFIFNDINLAQKDQFFASTNEGFNEVWFFYCSASSNTIDRYAVYNYSENNGEGVWYYGNMARTAWLDSGLLNNPIAATEVNNIVYHESGNDDNTTTTSLPINAVIETSEFDIDDGDHFGFVWRILPDITFTGTDQSQPSPQVTMTLIPLQNAGSGANVPQSVGGTSNATIQRIATAAIEEFTGQVYIRVRGRQMILKIESNQLGCAWQLGSPRIDIKQDGRRGNS